MTHRRCSFLFFSLAPSCKNISQMPPEMPCEEAGYAIARRTYECTGDGELANARYQLFEETYTCREIEVGAEDSGDLPTRDLFHCAFAIGELACELVDDYGDDLDLWMYSSNACPYVVEPKDGSWDGADTGAAE